MGRVNRGNRRRRVSVGDLSVLVQLQDRSVEAPAFGESEVDEDFEGAAQTWANVETTAGKVIFDEVSRSDVSVTHRVTIRFDPAVDTETWVRLPGGRRLDVRSVENLEERDEYLVLLCTETGSVDRAAAKA